MVHGIEAQNLGGFGSFERSAALQKVAKNVGNYPGFWKLHESGAKGECSGFQTFQFDENCRHQVFMYQEYDFAALHCGYLRKEGK